MRYTLKTIPILTIIIFGCNSSSSIENKEKQLLKKEIELLKKEKELYQHGKSKHFIQKFRELRIKKATASPLQKRVMTNSEIILLKTRRKNVNWQMTSCINRLI